MTVPTLDGLAPPATPGPPGASTAPYGARHHLRTTRARRRRVARTAALTFIVVLSLTALAVVGSFGAFVSSLSRTGTAKAGVVSLSDSAASTFSTPYSNLLPGDAGDRYFELVNDGDVDLTVSALVNADATVNPNNATSSDINGALVVTAYWCDGTFNWNGGSPTCSGAWTVFDETAGTGFNANTVANLSSDLKPFKISGGTSNQIAAAQTYGVKINVAVASSAPASLQGAQVTLTWTFAATQIAPRSNL